MKVLDVTLRDGGLRNNFQFDEEDVRNIIPALNKAGIDYIEVGYRNGVAESSGSLGKTGLCTNDYLDLCNSLCPKSKLVVMAYPYNLKQQDLMELKEKNIEMIRLCVCKKDLKEALELTQSINQMQIKVSLNLVQISQYKAEALEEILDEINHCKPHIVYFADSNGTLTPERTSALYKKFLDRYSFSFGFHAHDNLGLAQANAIAALNTGVEYIDLSLAGMGKGIGNLKTEFFVAYLLSKGIKKYKLDELVTAANYIRTRFNTENAALEMDDFIRGIFDYTPYL